MAAADSFVGDGLNPSPYKEAIARAERAEAERDALRADALRYRWLRERECWIRDPEGDKVVIAATGYGLDAAIDAARKEGEG